MAGGIVIILAAGLQGVVALFMAPLDGVSAANLAFLACLAPAFLAGLLACWVIQRSRVAVTGAEAEPRYGTRVARGAVLGIAIVCVLAEALWSVVATFLYTFFYGSWSRAGPSYSLGGVAFIIGPSLVLLMVAAWLMYAEARVAPEFDL